MEEQIKALEQEEQNIYLNAAEFGWDWKQPLTVKEAENTLLEQNKDWKKKESDVYAQKELLEQHQKNLQLEKQNAECTVDKLKTWRAGIEKDPLWGKRVLLTCGSNHWISIGISDCILYSFNQLRRTVKLVIFRKK